MNRRMAAAEQVGAVQTAFESDNATLDSLLDAQRRLADAEAAYYRSLVEYQLAVKNVQLEKGTLLDYNEVYLNEGAWPSKAYDHAELREAARGEPHNGDRPKTHAPWVSQGMYPQMLQPSGAVPPSADVCATAAFVPPFGPADACRGIACWR